MDSKLPASTYTRQVLITEIKCQCMTISIGHTDDDATLHVTALARWRLRMPQSNDAMFIFCDFPVRSDLFRTPNAPCPIALSVIRRTRRVAFPVFLFEPAVFWAFTTTRLGTDWFHLWVTIFQISVERRAIALPALANDAAFSLSVTRLRTGREFASFPAVQTN